MRFEPHTLSAKGGEWKGPAAVASWTRAKARANRRVRCLACGGRMEPALLHAGSPRCLECRESGRLLDPLLVEAQRRRSPSRSLVKVIGRRLLHPRRSGR